MSTSLTVYGFRPGASGAHHAPAPGQIFMGVKLLPRVYRIRRIFVFMNKLIPIICNLTVSSATPSLLN